ncbi:hypothetical protein [Aquamicrobium sp.]|uniref:hypothetical protein n=1 Tax=Aquamicrobium sp. TaxID=1872579 RepID=UPI00258DC9A7|nr:hypothetical protein [Aquamicrobium sp.]MCK9552896.1 hypothetical protein [Aquamicrobium sp.]
MTRTEPDAEAFIDTAERLMRLESRLSPLQAGLLAAHHLGIARDSRSFSRLLDIEHALVLREITALEETGELLSVTKRDSRTMRTFYEPGAGAARLLAALDTPHD